ncbi:SufE family protein [Pseudomonas mangrovi]|uniref:Fe-S metabolism protein SufE n=1 Tax=Pseudomonas mangrovi TaxID=2161748 RepID=A0A2T5PCM2_9PSED|nr:SufE family protein [Pseudomonas mangrovi]PTU75437.1 Fe-S metabolism protein SufE [Pseudomonas mangrovi]
MSELPAAARQALASFSAASGWEARARLLMQWGDRLQPLEPALQTEANRVQGCESRVWLIAERHQQGWHFRAYSDARLLRGLLAVLLARVDGEDPTRIAQLDLADWFAQLGLSRQLSPSRSNGLNAVLARIGEMVQG